MQAVFKPKQKDAGILSGTILNLGIRSTPPIDENHHTEQQEKVNLKHLS